MKRKITAFIFIIFVVLLSFSCTGCGKTVRAEDYLSRFAEPFSAVLKVRDGETDYTARVAYHADGKFELLFSEPSLLYGVGYSFSGDESYLIYNGMSIPLTEGKLHEGAAGGVTRWRGALLGAASAIDASAALSEKDGTGLVTVTMPGCTITFDRESRVPLSLESETFKIDFEDFAAEQ